MSNLSRFNTKTNVWEEGDEDDEAVLALVAKGAKGTPFADSKFCFGNRITSSWQSSIRLHREDTKVMIELTGTKGNPCIVLDITDPDFHIKVRNGLLEISKVWLYTGFINRSIRKLSNKCDKETIERLCQAADLIKSFGITNATMDKRIEKLDKRLESLE